MDLHDSVFYFKVGQYMPVGFSPFHKSLGFSFVKR